MKTEQQVMGLAVVMRNEHDKAAKDGNTGLLVEAYTSGILDALLWISESCPDNPKSLVLERLSVHGMEALPLILEKLKKLISHENN